MGPNNNLFGRVQALTVWDRQYLEYSEQKDHLINESMSNRGDCKTAPATPGLLKILHIGDTESLDRCGWYHHCHDIYIFFLGG